MYSGYVLPLLLILVFCTAIALTYVNTGGGVRNDNGAVVSSAHKIRRTYDNDTEPNSTDEDDDDHRDDNVYNERLRVLESHLSAERERNADLDARLKRITDEIADERENNRRLLHNKQSEHEADQTRLHALESQMAALSQEKARSENEVKSLREKLEAEKIAHQRQASEKETRQQQEKQRAEAAAAAAAAVAEEQRRSAVEEQRRRQQITPQQQPSRQTGGTSSLAAGAAATVSHHDHHAPGQPIRGTVTATVRNTPPDAVANTGAGAAAASQPDSIGKPNQAVPDISAAHTDQVPAEKRFVRHTELTHDKNWIDVSKLTVVMTKEISDAIAASIGTKDIANRYCVMKIPESAIPPGGSTERRVKKSLLIGEHKMGEPKRFARMKTIVNNVAAPTMIFHDYTPVVRQRIFYDFASDTVSDREGCSWHEFDVDAVHLGTEKLAKISKISLLVKSDAVPKKDHKNNNDNKKHKGNKKKTN